jgi:nucleoside 2-deoxyribosyltransferase
MAEEVNQPIKCVLCKGQVECQLEHVGSHVLNFDCKLCGSYSLQDLRLKDLMLPKFKDRFHLIRGCIREQNLHGQTPVNLTEESISDMLSLAPRTVLEKAGKLLIAIARKSRYPADRVSLDPDDSYPIGYCTNTRELKFYIEHLRVQRLIDCEPAGEDLVCIVLPEGWTAVESHRPSNLVSDKAFVAMWFDPSMRPAYDEGIEPAIIQAGYRSIRVDAQEFNSDVVEQIIAEIRESRFVIADVTGQRNGVYFEGGFALGLNLPTIWMCRQDEVGKLHFDTRQLNHIVWKDPADIRERLTRRILATIGPGPARHGHAIKQ